MNREAVETSLKQCRYQSAVCFVLLAYALSWAIEVPAFLQTRGLLHLRVSNGLQTLAQLCPAIAALLTAGWFHRAAVTLLASVVRVRASLRWYALAILLPWATQTLAMLLYRVSGYDRPVLGPWYQVPLLTAALAVFSLGEELGWRGFLLPNLLELCSPLAATGWTALLWGLWHLPFYFARRADGAQTGLVYLLFMAGIFPVSALFTFLYLNTRSVFLCALLHGAFNSGASYWFGALSNGAPLALGIWTAVLWITLIPIFLWLVKESKHHLSLPNH